MLSPVRNLILFFSSIYRLIRTACTACVQCTLRVLVAAKPASMWPCIETCSRHWANSTPVTWASAGRPTCRMQNCGLGSSCSSSPCRHASWPIPHPRLQRHGERCRDCSVVFCWQWCGLVRWEGHNFTNERMNMTVKFLLLPPIYQTRQEGAMKCGRVMRCLTSEISIQCASQF